MGAASQTITLSGSTIWAERELLPLRNLPVSRLRMNGRISSVDLSEKLEQAAVRWDANQNGGQIAIAIDVPPKMDFATLQAIASAVVDYAQNRPDPSAPVVLILEHDFAQVLGQSIKAMNPRLPVVVIDQVGLDEGDFIDLGVPILAGRVVPLSVKTLVFYH